MLIIEKINFKSFPERIRLTKQFIKAGCKVDNEHDLGYILVTKEVPEQ